MPHNPQPPPDVDALRALAPGVPIRVTADGDEIVVTWSTGREAYRGPYPIVEAYLRGLIGDGGQWSTWVPSA